jgi:hypothetical protein
MGIFAASRREKYENMVFIRQDGEFRLDNLITCKEGLLLSLMNAFPTSRKTAAVDFFSFYILLNFFNEMDHLHCHAESESDPDGSSHSILYWFLYLEPKVFRVSWCLRTYITFISSVIYKV